MADAANFDIQMASQAGCGEMLTWYPVPCDGITVMGLGFSQEALPWKRLPDALEAVVGKERPELLELSTHMAGVSLRFLTDSPQVWVRARLTSAPYMAHMTPAGQCGFDAYIRSPEETDWHFRGLSKFPVSDDRLECCLAGNLPGPREICVNLPLYIGVTELSVGLVPGATLSPCRGFSHRRSVAVYGTSIDQGGCASRPGMAWPAILSRAMDRPFYNLGFSGNGVGQPAMADFLCGLPDLGLLIVDIQANAGPNRLLRKNLPLFLDRVRTLAPDLPVLVLSASAQADEQAYALRAGHSFREDEAFQEETVARRMQAGDSRIRFVSSRELLSPLGVEATVDGVHLTDLGFYQLSLGLLPILRELLSAC